MSLFCALQAGGFDWSIDDENTHGFNRKPIFDSDGVSLSQRKNQLNRRLRQLKKKAVPANSWDEQELKAQDRPQPKKQEDQHSEIEFGGHVSQEARVLPPPRNMESSPATREESQNYMCKKTDPSIPKPSALKEEQEGLSRSFSPPDGVSNGKILFEEETIKSMELINSTSPRKCNEDMLMSTTRQTSSLSFESTHVPSDVTGFFDQINKKAEDISDSCTFSSPSFPIVSEEEKMKLAIRLFHIKNAILLKTSLLKAGFSAEENIESSTIYQEFVKRATEEALGKW
eukprot:CAMPEP_0185727918 /NCGR_PEP_ID=MMETSP1171-20130828/3453_1 /TAXON_ID=374046 /ORGANISM="Helicotheca tamensis, Strain CCMP826" /LENGTH=285 /DNA_ID=CAMNT_0028396563 /DNA_START=174 /DNA_END=1028 /DNA_ORIENTATION=+